VLLLERSHVGTADQDGAERAAFADQRHGEDGTLSEPDRQFPPERRYRGPAKDRKDELFLHVFANKILTTGAAQPGGSIQGCETKPRARIWARRQASVIRGKRGFVFVGTVRSLRQKLSYELQKRITVARRRTEYVKHRQSL
jgi:hypothetical protein